MIRSFWFTLLLFYCLFLVIRPQNILTEKEKYLEERFKLLEDKLNRMEASLINCDCFNYSRASINDSILVLESLIQCPNGSTPFNQSCWRYYDQLLNWTSAQNHCHLAGGHLASIHSQAENDFAATFWFRNESFLITNDSDVCFVKFPQKMLIGHAEDVLLSVSLEKCKAVCASLLINCTSFMYYPDLHECIITSKSRFSHPDLFMDVISDMVDYYDKIACTVDSSNECNGSYHDIMLLVDGSGSIGPLEFPKIKRFLNLLVDTSEVGVNKTQIGMIQFSSFQWSEFPLNAYKTNKEVRDAIDKVPYRQGGTLIGRAIQYVIQWELRPKYRGRRPEYPLLVIIITDGFSQDDPTLDAQQLRSMGATVITIGVTEAVSKNQLINIAGSENRVFLVRDFNSLNVNLTNLISMQLCAEMGVWLGLNDQRIDRIYQWSDGLAPSFFNWADNQPDDKEHSMNCVVMNDSPIGTWSDTSCLSLKPFLCRMPINNNNQSKTKANESQVLIEGNLVE